MKKLKQTASRLFVFGVLTAAGYFVWEGFNTIQPPQTGSLRAWLWDWTKTTLGRL